MTPARPIGAERPAMDLRLGRWEDVLTGVECDALICDPPYSERTHKGHDAGVAATRNGRVDVAVRRDLGYLPWTDADVDGLVRFWHPRTRGWIVLIVDHVLARAAEGALASVGRYVFAPLPFVEVGRGVRLAGDGPSSWTCWVVVARPRTVEMARWGTLSGAYIGRTASNGVRAGRRMGGKPLDLMRAIVRDYSRPGDLVCDPCAGGGTTLRAAVAEGRRAVGAEMDPETWRRATQGGDAPLLAGVSP
jgi:site-specific DNA-methyltransferase (adenine-specific)